MATCLISGLWEVVNGTRAELENTEICPKELLGDVFSCLEFEIEGNKEIIGSGSFDFAMFCKVIAEMYSNFSYNSASWGNNPVLIGCQWRATQLKEMDDAKAIEFLPYKH